MSRILRAFSIVCVAAVSLLACPAPTFAQSQSITVTDQRVTERTIRGIIKTADAAELGLTRLATNVDILLNRLSESGADDMRLQDVADFYSRSATAARFRNEARINRDADRQLLRLRAKANSEDLIAELEEERDLAIAEIIAAETETLDAIDASLEVVLAVP